MTEGEIKCFRREAARGGGGRLWKQQREGGNEGERKKTRDEGKIGGRAEGLKEAEERQEESGDGC